jgi:hypothetical protein
MEFLEEWALFGVDLKNLHFSFAGVKLNRNFATKISNFTYITGQDLFDFIQNRSNPWAPSIVGSPIFCCENITSKLILYTNSFLDDLIYDLNFD